MTSHPRFTFSRAAQRQVIAGLVAVVALVLVGCSARTSLAPVEDRSFNSNGPIAQASGYGAVAPVRPPLGSENAGKAGYFTVRPGDTVRSIGRELGVPWQDIVRWNRLDNPDLIEPGQVLRVAPPTGTPGAISTGVSQGSRPVASVVVGAEPSQAAKTGAAASGGSAGGNVIGGTTSSSAAPSNAAVNNGSGDDAIAWIWPTNGPVVGVFDETKNKGVKIGGKLGDPIFAAADGVVVYSGSGLRGYGNLVILKHNATYLTAYAHNQTLLVKEDQQVRKGQKIAEMGNSDSDRVALHFEVRRNSKPVDPMRYLPIR